VAATPSPCSDAERLARTVSRFAVAARAYQRALDDLDEERAAAHVRVLSGLYGVVVREGEAGLAAFLELLDDGDDAVAGMAAVYALASAPERSLVVLRRLAAGEGLLAFRARHVVERWEAGEWQQPGE
jgi:hypothetical protein